MYNKNNILNMPTLGNVKYALEAGFRHFDCAELYRTEIGEVLKTLD